MRIRHVDVICKIIPRLTRLKHVKLIYERSESGWKSSNVLSLRGTARVEKSKESTSKNTKAVMILQIDN
jgi:hypothetical protein